MNQKQSAVFYRFLGLFVLGFIGLLAAGFSIAFLRSAPVKAQSEEFLAPSLVVFSENFDSVTAPALPAGWTTARSGQLDFFSTVTTSPDSPPNAAFVNNPNTQGTSELVSPSIALGNLQHKLIFRNFYQTDFEFDGGVLEISINGGTFQDILSAGGSFVTGGYNATLIGGTLSGRQSWTGQQSGYITTEVNLPASTNNQSVRFRWRFGTDPMEGGTGWWIDSVRVTNNISGTNTNAISIPLVGTASPYPSEVNISDQDGLVTNVQVQLTNFSHNSPDDVDLMLVAPNGNKVILMSDVGGTNPVNNLNLLISDTAGVSFPDNSTITAGTYRPTDFEPGDAFPAPAPQGAPTGTKLSALNGSPGNGTWRLFLVDDNGGNAGSINGGWNLFLQSSPDVLAIPEVGIANPYPSQRMIAGLQGTITKASVTLSNFSHTSPDDVDIMLVAPNGRSVIIMSDVGGNTEVGGLNITLDDDAVANLPDNAALTSGTFKPTNFESGDVFPAPAPQGEMTGTTLNAFFGSAPNGVWRLFVVDDNGGNAGSIAGNWSLNLQTSTTACAFALSPSVQAFPVSGGSGSFAINMPAGCSWTASTTSGFITISSSASGNGSGTINFTVAQNLSGARAGTIEVSNGAATRLFQVQQPSGCPLSVSQSAVNFSAAGGSGNVSVNAGSVCSWQALSNAGWVQVTSAQQTGDGTAAFNVQPNTNANTRSATIFIGAQAFTVNQAGVGGRRFDFDGDGKADVSVFRQSEGVWYLNNSQSGFTGFQFGLGTDKLVPADYDGDRKTDIAVFREGVWYIFQSQTNTMRVEFWGLSDDILVPGDYDGDGRADIAVYRPSNGTWYVRRSMNGALQAAVFGLSTDKPVPADYDGDGRMDFALYRAGISGVSSWAILNSSNGASSVLQFGSSGDIAVPGDFNGDGRDSVAVFRPSTGIWYTSPDPATNYGARLWGMNGDIPVPADYDGDGKTDLAVFRQGVWYILNSASETIRGEVWGLSSDKPVPAAYTPE